MMELVLPAQIKTIIVHSAFSAAQMSVPVFPANQLTTSQLQEYAVAVTHYRRGAASVP